MKLEEIGKVANERYPYNDFAYNGFIEGAKWRINSVWHDASEQPIEFTACLVELESQHGFFYKLKSFNKMQIKNWSGKYGCDKIVRWAYIEDLIPNKEDENFI